MVALAAAAAVAACDSPAPVGEQSSAPIRTGEPAGNQVNTAAAVQPAEAGDLPEPSDGLRFVGKWAPDQKSCESAAWQVTQTALHTPGGTHCSFNRVSEVPGGYDIQATCTAEAPPTSDTLKLRFAESAKAMLLESETVGDASLLFCGRDV